MSIEFLITSLIVVASPGTGVLYTLAAGLSRGSRASVVAAFGCTLGIVPHLAAAILGLAALLHTSALAFQLFKYAGVAYLLYMAWMTLREHGTLKVEREVIAIDGIEVGDLDYIDIGAPMGITDVIPVTVKSLMFPGSKLH